MNASVVCAGLHSWLFMLQSGSGSEHDWGDRSLFQDVFLSVSNVQTSVHAESGHK